MILSFRVTISTDCSVFFKYRSGVEKQLRMRHDSGRGKHKEQVVTFYSTEEHH
jgi:hypothetical protein